jgi:pSer/pThr/pTyr-binding forkhead associated (FHA) protein
VLGRVEGDIIFGDDQLVSRRHAQFTITNEGLVVEDLKSANGVYRRLRKNHPLKDGDIILMGRQMFRFSNNDAAMRDGGKSSGRFTKADLQKPAELIRILPGGIEETHYALPPGESVLGRTKGTINFPEDAYLSSQHARVRNTDGAYTLEDLQAVNGTFIAVHEPARLEDGDILLIGHQLLRVTSTAP